MMYLNHTKLELRKMSKPALVKIGHAILKRLPKSTLVNTVHKLEQLAKSKGIRSIGKIARKAGKKARKVGRKAKTKIRRRAKTARSYPLRLGGKRYRNGRTFKSRRKSAQFVKGSPQAKAWGRKMAMLRAR